MKSILLFVLILASVTSAEQHKCGGFLHYIEWTIGAKLVKEETGYHYSSKSEDLIACKIVDTNKHHKKAYIEIKEPFVSQLHPEHIKKRRFYPQPLMEMELYLDIIPSMALSRLNGIFQKKK